MDDVNGVSSFVRCVFAKSSRKEIWFLSQGEGSLSLSLGGTREYLILSTISAFFSFSLLNRTPAVTIRKDTRVFRKATASKNEPFSRRECWMLSKYFPRNLQSDTDNGKAL